MAYISFHGFRLGIPEAQDLGRQLAGLNPGDPYTVELKNWGEAWVEVDVTLDGVPSGRFTVPPRGALTLAHNATHGHPFLFLPWDPWGVALGYRAPHDSVHAGLVMASFLQPPLPLPSGEEGTWTQVTIMLRLIPLGALDEKNGTEPPLEVPTHLSTPWPPFLPP